MTAVERRDVDAFELRGLAFVTADAAARDRFIADVQHDECPIRSRKR